jgi:hypothetical protein
MFIAMIVAIVSLVAWRNLSSSKTAPIICLSNETKAVVYSK